MNPEEDDQKSLAYRDALERRALAAWKKAKAKRGEADKLEREVAAMRKQARGKKPPVRPESSRAGARISASNTKHHWPFSVALHGKGLSPPAWARRQRNPRVSEAKVCSWLKSEYAHRGRQVPRYWADCIAAEFATEDGGSLVPAVDASWPCGIKEDDDNRE